MRYALVFIVAAACVPQPHDTPLSITLVRGDDDPLSDPGNVMHGSSPVGSIEVDLTVGMQTLMETIDVGTGKSLSVRAVPDHVTGPGSVVLLGIRSEDGLVYSTARSPPFILDGGALALDLFFGPADAVTPVGAPVPEPRSAVALAPLGNFGALLAGGDTALDGGSVPASPGLLAFRSTDARLCGFDGGCLSGDEPEPRSGAIATALQNGSVLHGLGQLADGGFDSTLFLTTPDGNTQRLTLGGDPLPGLKNAAAVTLLQDGIVMIAGGEGLSGISAAIFHVDVGKRQVAAQTVPLSNARSQAGAVRLSRGNVVLVGGTGTSGPLDTVEVYKPGVSSLPLDGGGFTQVRTNLHSKRVNPALARLPDDSVTIAGGGAVEVEVFRDDLGTVGGLVDLPLPPAALRVVTPAAAKLVSGDLLLIGGEVSSAAPVCAVFTPSKTDPLDDAHPVYGGAWRACGAGLNLRARANAVVLPDESVLVVGGGLGGEPFNPGMPSATRVEVFEPSPR